MCPRCFQRYRPIQFDDRYVFVLPAKLARGDVLRGESVADGSPTFVVVGSPTGLDAPEALLERFFALQNEGKDVTLAGGGARSAEAAAGCAEAFPAVATHAVGGLPRVAVGGRHDNDFKLGKNLFAERLAVATSRAAIGSAEAGGARVAALPADFPAATATAQLVNPDCAAHLDGSGLRFPAETVGIAPAGERSAGEGAARGGVTRLTDHARRTAAESDLRAAAMGGSNGTSAALGQGGRRPVDPRRPEPDGAHLAPPVTSALDVSQQSCKNRILTDTDG